MGGEVLRKKSERGRMLEVGEREERRWGRGGRVGKGGVVCCVLAVAREEKRATDKSVAAARFSHTRYY